MTPERKELLRMVRAISDRGVVSGMDWVGMVYRKERGEAAIAELEALKAGQATQPKPREAKPVKLAGNVVALHPDRRAQP